MRISELLSVLSTSALIAIGGMYVFGGADEATETTASVALPVVQAPQAPTPQVTRNVTETQSISAIDDLANVVAQSTQTIQRNGDLTPEQMEAIEFFERTARQLNENNQSDPTANIQFSNLAVKQLNVRYFYRIAQPYSELNINKFLGAQTVRVLETLCTEESIQTLIKEYGFKYSYSYLSSDNRLVGVVHSDSAFCR